MYKLYAWFFLIIGFTFGILDRTYNLYIDDGYYNAIDLVQLFTVLFFILILLILYPFEFNKDE